MTYREEDIKILKQGDLTKEMKLMWSQKKKEQLFFMSLIGIFACLLGGGYLVGRTYFIQKTSLYIYQVFGIGILIFLGGYLKQMIKVFRLNPSTQSLEVRGSSISLKEISKHSFVLQVGKLRLLFKEQIQLENNNNYILHYDKNLKLLYAVEKK